MTRNLSFDSDVRQWSHPLMISLHCLWSKSNNRARGQFECDVTWFCLCFPFVCSHARCGCCSIVCLPFQVVHHLDSQNRTINAELEKKNFWKAGEVLAEIWRRLVMDGNPVVAEFAADQNEEVDVNHSWMKKHCRASQYMLQIVKCDDKFAVWRCDHRGRMCSRIGFFQPQSPRSTLVFLIVH